MFKPDVTHGVGTATCLSPVGLWMIVSPRKVLLQMHVSLLQMSSFLMEIHLPLLMLVSWPFTLMEVRWPFSLMVVHLSSFHHYKFSGP